MKRPGTRRSDNACADLGLIVMSVHEEAPENTDGYWNDLYYYGPRSWDSFEMLRRYISPESAKQIEEALEKSDKEGGAFLVTARKRIPKLTREKVAQILGLSARTLESWESGARTVPEDDEKKLLDFYAAMAILTAEGREAVYSGEWTLKDLKLNYKIDKVKEISKIGRYGTTFSYQWKLIPAKIKELADPEDLAALVDVLYEQYQNGQNARG